jgi:GAF domain-containing protein
VPAIEGVAHLAQRVLDAPMAVVSVPNTHRHDFAAHVGLDVDGVARPDPIFEEVLRADGPIAIDDTTQDARMRQHELVVRGGVRACLLDALRASDRRPARHPRRARHAAAPLDDGAA